MSKKPGFFEKLTRKIGLEPNADCDEILARLDVINEQLVNALMHWRQLDKCDGNICREDDLGRCPCRAWAEERGIAT